MADFKNKCIVCGKEFIAKRKNRLFCSNHCIHINYLNNNYSNVRESCKLSKLKKNKSYQQQIQLEKLTKACKLKNIENIKQKASNLGISYILYQSYLAAGWNPEDYFTPKT